VKEYLARLLHDGLLLKSDPELPSVATLVAGGPVRGSWWAHPASHAIFMATEELAARPDVVIVKLVSGKDTFVQERLWPELLAVATAHERWQFAGLTKSAEALHKLAVGEGEVPASGADARLLESRLLVRAEPFHTEAGHHEKRLECWEHWAQRIGFADRALPPVAASKAAFERIYPTAKWLWRSRRGRSSA